ncbi:hypothetical protein [Paenibacillus macquariensis]|uniref:Uncharacterized protein n=1 Tax=Paenibacillus macquariensis TaxID=948756 RepID=A0ABY1KFS9_9BACL|nr:hypothetical protein [Paenibacillus macquariensis]MEC0093204.1 hypothetical protein [Paenibacillus macquariensis]OAB35053.1 hypothetical protein PMSM_10725 [Paenibacillus macquariensis subsp. macquariensis]SIR62754.1 hypothetical protein SAMN05421578_12433 [Paenibacillus macquariensis]
MLQTEVVEFLNTFYLNKGCVLEHETLYESEHGYEINIMRVSSRMRKRVGNITGGNNDMILNTFPTEEGEGTTYPSDELLKIYYSPKVRKLEKDLLKIAGATSVFQEWLRQGWILRRVDYESDGKTVKQSVYGMGYSLYMVVESKRQQEDERLEVRCEEWKIRLTEVFLVTLFWMNSIAL